MNVSELIKILQEVPNPTATAVAVTTAGAVAAGLTVTVNDTGVESQDIDAQTAGVVVIEGAA